MKQLITIVLTAFALCAMSLPVSVYGQGNNSYEVEYIPHESHKDFRFAVGGGYAMRLGKVLETGNAKLDDMSKSLRHGYNIDADAQYFFKESWGLGVNVNWNSSAASSENVTLLGSELNSYKETQSILYAGPSFVTRNEGEKFLLVSSIGLGPLFYFNDATMDGVVINGRKTTFGVNAGIAGEYKLNAKTGVGLKLSYTLGSIDSINLDGRSNDLEETITLSNLMISAFISFRRW